jgi:hypothetical protein
MVSRNLSMKHRLACVTDETTCRPTLKRIEPPGEFEDVQPKWGRRSRIASGGSRCSAGTPQRRSASGSSAWIWIASSAGRWTRCSIAPEDFVLFKGTHERALQRLMMLIRAGAGRRFTTDFDQAGADESGRGVPRVRPGVAYAHARAERSDVERGGRRVASSTATCRTPQGSIRRCCSSPASESRGNGAGLSVHARTIIASQRGRPLNADFRPRDHASGLRPLSRPTAAARGGRSSANPSGAWQRNEELTADSALAFHAVSPATR